MVDGNELARTAESSVVSSRTLVVVPALNEAGSVARVVANIREHLPSADVVVVDDHSGDDTAAEARSAGATVVSLPFTLGVGGAMRTGYSYARRHGYQQVVQVDGDGQHDVRDLPRLVAALAGADVVIGARFADDQAYAVGGARRFAMRVLAFVMSLVVGTRLTDSTSGYRALGPRAVALFAEHYPAEYLGDTVEALVIARKCRLVITQVPVRMTAREHGRPSQGVVRSLVYLGRALVAIGLGLVRRWTCPAAVRTAP
jgi:glycosyltransferase involved in cell wall biosynthesis